MEIAVGQEAPDFTLTATEVGSFQLSTQRGHYVVLFFYPKDMTPG